MKENEDAHGQELFNYYINNEGAEIIERDDGFIAASTNVSAYFAPYNQWPVHQQEAMKLAHGRVLDIGAGAGRHSLYLQNQGLEVTAVDNSPKAVELCRLRGVNDARLLPITKISRHIEPFDTIIMMGNNFGLFANPQRAKRLLRRFHNLTFDGGTIIAETNDPYQTERPDHLEYHEFNRQRGRMPGQLRLRVRYRKFKTPWMDYLMVSKDEMKEIVADTGWHIDHFIDSESPIYIVVLEKDSE
ncbi:MAG: class I SAM-dependent methyltransferase [Anaerolineales bacterium]|nr:class I SAM-dependent methyltransferase [Chloroflexota bacterium]MBL6982902.1 class I SAM-dependent methyltransferase [Anaerolineales bacterium]